MGRDPRVIAADHALKEFDAAATGPNRTIIRPDPRAI